MTTIRTFCLAFFATTIALGAMAQAPAAPSASTPAAGSATPPDCAKPAARHDHGVEKGVYAPKSKPAPCAAATPAKAASAPAKRLKHDHTGFR